MMRVLVMQFMFFMLYGLISGAAFKQIYDYQQAMHQKEVASLLTKLPIKALGEVKIRNI